MADYRIYFASTDAAGIASLWETDGTANGTRQIYVPSTRWGINPSSFAVLNGQAYFSGADANGRTNLFKIDGTTDAVSEIVPPVASSYYGLAPSGTGSVNGKLYFLGRNRSDVPSLFSSDGTAAGTVELPLSPGATTVRTTGLTAGGFTAFNGKLFFHGSPLVLNDLYVSDGTPSGTSAVPLSNGGTFGPRIETIASIGTKLVFEALDANTSPHLYVSDGTAAGTSVVNVAGLNPSGRYEGHVTGLVSSGSKAAFTAYDASNRPSVWVTDGTGAGTVELTGITAKNGGIPMVAMNGGRFAFIANDGAGTSTIYVSDGTVAGTKALQVQGSSSSGLAPHGLLSSGDTVLFDGATTSGTRGLFSSDGTSSGTRLVQMGVNLAQGSVGSDFALLTGAAINAPTNNVPTPANLYIAGRNQAFDVESGSVTMANDASGNTVRLGKGDCNVVTVDGTVVRGGAGRATVKAGSGSTIAVGGAGAMTYQAGNGSNVVFAGTGGLTFTGGAGTDVVVGGGNALSIQGGSGGGTFFGGGNATIRAGSGAQTIMVGANGDKMYSAGATGDLFGVSGAGDVLMDGSASTGADIFFGAAGTGTLTFITGSGDAVLGLGQGTNLVTLGAGHDTVFANTGTTGVSTITLGTGQADIGLGGKSVDVLVQAGSAARTVNLFNFVPGADHVRLSGFSATAAADAIAGQSYANGSTTLTLADRTAITLIGVTRADASLFG